MARDWMRRAAANLAGHAGNVAARWAAWMLDGLEVLDRVRQDAPLKLRELGARWAPETSRRLGEFRERVEELRRRPLQEKTLRDALKPALDRAAEILADARAWAKVGVKPPRPAARWTRAPGEVIARGEAQVHVPEPTDPGIRLDSGSARVTTTSRGRKVVPIAAAAARRARAKAQPPHLQPKRGQKKKHH